MAIEELEIELSSIYIPEAVAKVIEASDRRWEQFFAARGHRRAPRFVPSEPELVFAALQEVTQRGLPTGHVFCEWGSGFGTATCLAALLGYEAYGLEIHEELADISRDMAQQLGISVEICCASFLPEGYESYSGVGGEDLVKPESFGYFDDEIEGELRYDGMGLDIAEIDLFFAYPWPEEQELIQQLFDAVAVEGAILVAYHSAKEICVFRKLFDGRERV